MKTNLIPSVELFVATGCVHCPAVLNELSESLKKGLISNLNVTNIAVDNKRADELNVRGVPWFSLSTVQSCMIFSGNYSPKEIQQWITLSKKDTGMQKYIEESLANGELMNIAQAIDLKPDVFSTIINMLGDEEVSMDIRIGLDAIIEQFSVTETLQSYTDDLKKIASGNIPRLQIDALHYIALSGDSNNKSYLQEKTKNSDTQIKQAAIEALETLDDLLN